MEAVGTTVKEVLEDARAHLVGDYHWVQYRYAGVWDKVENRCHKLLGGDNPDCFCSAGAVQAVTIIDHIPSVGVVYAPIQERVMDTLVSAIDSLYPDFVDERFIRYEVEGQVAHTSEDVVIEFNDTGGRTEEEVLEVFDRAIQMAGGFIE